MLARWTSTAPNAQMRDLSSQNGSSIDYAHLGNIPKEQMSDLREGEGLGAYLNQPVGVFHFDREDGGGVTWQFIDMRAKGECLGGEWVSARYSGLSEMHYAYSCLSARRLSNPTGVEPVAPVQ